MKITSFNPMIVTKNPEPVIQLFEDLGFERRHQKKGISDQDITGVRFKNADGFHVDVAIGEFPQDLMVIRMNVDNMEEAVEMLTAHGFRRSQKINDNGDTPSSKFNVMISPSGFIFNIIQHIK